MLLGAAPLLLCALGCSGARPVQRGDWQRVWVEEFARHDAQSPQEVLSLEAYEREVAASIRRSWKPPTGWAPTPFERATAIELMRGEVHELELDETTRTTLSVEGDAAKVYWTHPSTIEWWEDGRERTRTASRVLVHARRTGRLTLHVAREGADQVQRVVVSVQ